MKKTLKFILVFSIILAICIVINRFRIAIIERPVFIELSITPPNSHLGDNEWDVTIKSIHQYTAKGGNEGKYFLLRKEKVINLAELGGETDISVLDTREELISYFDDWLMSNGWERYVWGFDPCVNFLPESGFVPSGENGYLDYAPRDETLFPAHPMVCLAVLEDSNLDDRAYHVVLVSINPSPITILNEDWKSINRP
jgi:hypothetical protein